MPGLSGSSRYCITRNSCISPAELYASLTPFWSSLKADAFNFSIIASSSEEEAVAGAATATWRELIMPLSAVPHDTKTKVPHNTKAWLGYFNLIFNRELLLSFSAFRQWLWQGDFLRHKSRQNRSKTHYRTCCFMA